MRSSVSGSQRIGIAVAVLSVAGRAVFASPSLSLLNSKFYVGNSQGIVYGLRFPLP
jgi:hypothetical protein